MLRTCSYCPLFSLPVFEMYFSHVDLQPFWCMCKVFGVQQGSNCIYTAFTPPTQLPNTIRFFWDCFCHSRASLSSFQLNGLCNTFSCGPEGDKVIQFQSTHTMVHLTVPKQKGHGIMVNSPDMSLQWYAYSYLLSWHRLSPTCTQCRCYGLKCVPPPPNSYVEALTPRTQESDQKSGL